MPGKFFDLTAVDAFVATVVADVQRTLPPERNEGQTKQAQRQREQVQDRVRRHAETLATSARLNVYQKARLGMRLREALEAAGYSEAFAKPLAYEVMSCVASATSKQG